MLFKYGFLSLNSLLDLQIVKCKQFFRLSHNSMDCEEFYVIRLLNEDLIVTRSNIIIEVLINATTIIIILQTANIYMAPYSELLEAFTCYQKWQTYRTCK